jgi:RNA polymerase-binding transcription factor DksA
MDAADLATENEAKAMALFERQRRERIAESFGPRLPDKKLRCRDCNRLIGLKRLKAHPCASRCTQCAENIEREGFV